MIPILHLAWVEKDTVRVVPCPITWNLDSGPVDTECSTQAISSQCPNPQPINGQKMFIQGIIFLIINMKKLLDSDWLGAVQFKSNTSAKGATLVQKVYHQCKWHIIILDYDWLKDNSKFSKTMISRKLIIKILCRNFEKRFQGMRKNVFKKDTLALFPRWYLRSNHKVFLVQFGINLQLWVFQKAHSPKWLV